MAGNSGQRIGRPILAPSLRLIGGAPAPGARAEAARHDPVAVDVGDDVAVAGQQRLGRAHLGAQWQFAFADPVAAVAALADRGEMVGRFARPAIAEGAFVHLAAAAEIAGLRVLRRAERAGVETVAATDA